MFEQTPERAREVAAVERRGFEQLAIGEVFELPTRTLTQEHFDAFQMLTGDDHPMHYDLEECRRRGHENLLAHGLGVTALGAAGAGTFPYVVEEVMMGFLDQSSRFLAPVVLGDTLRSRLTISELKRQRTTGVVMLKLEIENQDGVTVAEGEHRYLLRLQT